MVKKVVEEAGIYYYLNGYLHREDGPAIEYINGNKVWCINGQRHRENGPAIEFINGDKYWYKNGRLHREDGPARIDYNGRKEYWYEDKCLNCSSDEELRSLIKLKLLW